MLFSVCVGFKLNERHGKRKVVKKKKSTDCMCHYSEDFTSLSKCLNSSLVLLSTFDDFRPIYAFIITVCGCVRVLFFFFLSQVYILKHNSTVWFLFRGFLFAYMWWERKGGVSDACEFACCESYA